MQCETVNNYAAWESLLGVKSYLKSHTSKGSIIINKKLGKTGQRQQSERLTKLGTTRCRRMQRGGGERRSAVVELPATTAMERRWSVRQPVLPSTAPMAPLDVVRRRVAGPTCRRPARLRTDCSISVIFGTVFDHVASDVTWSNVQGQESKVKMTAWKRRLIAKSLLPFRKSELLNLMTMSEFWSEDGKIVVALAVQIWPQLPTPPLICTGEAKVQNLARIWTLMRCSSERKQQCI